MKPHRPIDLDTFNSDFFSGQEEKPSAPAAENRVFTHSPESDAEVAKKLALHPALTADVIDGLMKLTTSSDNPVFHNLGDADSSQEHEAEENSTESEVAEEPKPASPKRSTGVSEEEALRSFPDFEFDPTMFEPSEVEKAASQDDIPDENGNPDVEEDKLDGKVIIKEEKAKIKAQKKLEKKIQRPFKSRRLLSFLMAVMILLGLVMTAVIGLLSKTGYTPETAFKIGSNFFCYVDGVNIQSSEIKDGLVLISEDTVKSTETILYRHNNETRIEKIVAVGDNSYGIRYEGNPMQVIQPDEVKGIVLFALNDINPIYDLAHNRTVTALAFVFAYLAAVIIIFSVLISVRNKRIKKYREDYQLVS